MFDTGASTLQVIFTCEAENLTAVFVTFFFFSPKNEKRRNRAQNLQESMRIHAYSNIEWKLLFFLFPWSDLLMRVEIFMVGVENKLHKRMIRYTLFWTQWFARSFWLEPLRPNPEVSGCGQKSTLQEHYDAGHCTLVTVATVAPLKPSEFMSSDFFLGLFIQLPLDYQLHVGIDSSQQPQETVTIIYIDPFQDLSSVYMKNYQELARKRGMIW